MQLYMLLYFFPQWQQNCSPVRSMVNSKQVEWGYFPVFLRPSLQPYLLIFLFIFCHKNHIIVFIIWMFPIVSATTADVGTTLILPASLHLILLGMHFSDIFFYQIGHWSLGLQMIEQIEMHSDFYWSFW